MGSLGSRNDCIIAYAPTRVVQILQFFTTWTDARTTWGCNQISSNFGWTIRTWFRNDCHGKWIILTTLMPTYFTNGIIAVRKCIVPLLIKQFTRESDESSAGSIIGITVIVIIIIIILLLSWSWPPTQKYALCRSALDRHRAISETWVRCMGRVIAHIRHVIVIYTSSRQTISSTVAGFESFTLSPGWVWVCAAAAARKTNPPRINGLVAVAIHRSR